VNVPLGNEIYLIMKSGSRGLF